MKVSIIVINYNTFNLTSKCLRTIYQNTVGVSFEILVVDNASTECSPGRFKEEFPEIIVVENKENIGFAKGNNIGIAKASGDVVLLLNSDTELVEDSISLCCKKLEEPGSGIGALTCKLIHPDGRIQQQCYKFPSISLQLIELFRIHKFFFNTEKRREKMLGTYFNGESDIKPDWVWGTFFMIKREVVDKMPKNKLNEEYFMYCEDMKWCYDIKMEGMEVYYYSKTKIIHHIGKSSDSITWKQQNIVTNELDFVKRVRGKAYAVCYGFSRSLNLFSAGRVNRDLAKLYLNLSFKLLKKG